MLNSGLSRPQEGPSSDPGQPADYWINRGLVYLVESNGVIWTRKGRASRIIGAGGPKLVPTKLGMAMGFGPTHGTGTTDRVDGKTLARSAGFRSFVSFSYAVSTGGGGFGRISQPLGTAGPTADDEAWYINGTTSKFQYNRINSAGSGGAWHIAGSAVTGAWKCYGVTHDQTAVGNTPALYEDGYLATTTVITASTGSYSVAAYTPTFGNRSTDSLRGWDGLLGPQIIFDHPYAGLTAAEHKWLAEDPARIYETPPVRVNWFAQVANAAQSVVPSVGSIAITGYAPTVARTANQATAPGVGSLTITGYAPTVSQNVNTDVAPNVGAIALTGYAPTVAQTVNQTVLPGAGSIAISGYAPDVVQTANQAVLPGVGSLFITGYAPTVVQASASTSVTPDVGAITITGYAPTVTQTGQTQSGGGDGGTSKRKYYIRRRKQILIFDSVAQVDAYIEAEEEAAEAIAKAKSRGAKKRAIARVFKEQPEAVEITPLAELIESYKLPYNVGELIASENYQQIVDIQRIIQRIRDDEDEELLLLLA